MKILTGKIAKAQLKKILEKDTGTHKGRDTHKYFYKSIGYFKEAGKYTAFDNSTNDCWVEQFETEEKAFSWCKGEFQTV